MDYCIYLKGHTSANDVTRQTYVRGLRTILYFCMERLTIKSQPQNEWLRSNPDG